MSDSSFELPKEYKNQCFDRDIVADLEGRRLRTIGLLAGETRSYFRQALEDEKLEKPKLDAFDARFNVVCKTHVSADVDRLVCLWKEHLDLKRVLGHANDPFPMDAQMLRVFLTDTGKEQFKGWIPRTASGEKSRPKYRVKDKEFKKVKDGVWKWETKGATAYINDFYTTIGIYQTIEGENIWFGRIQDYDSDREKRGGHEELIRVEGCEFDEKGKLIGTRLYQNKRLLWNGRKKSDAQKEYGEYDDPLPPKLEEVPKFIRKLFGIPKF